MELSGFIELVEDLPRDTGLALVLQLQATRGSVAEFDVELHRWVIWPTHIVQSDNLRAALGSLPIFACVAQGGVAGANPIVVANGYRGFAVGAHEVGVVVVWNFSIGGFD